MMLVDMQCLALSCLLHAMPCLVLHAMPCLVLPSCHALLACCASRTSPKVPACPPRRDPLFSLLSPSSQSLPLRCLFPMPTRPEPLPPPPTHPAASASNLSPLVSLQIFRGSGRGRGRRRGVRRSGGRRGRSRLEPPNGTRTFFRASGRARARARLLGSRDGGVRVSGDTRRGR